MSYLINPELRHGFLFAQGEMTQADSFKFRDLSEEAIAYIAGWSHGCPVVDDCLADPDWGASKITRRYFDVNLFHRVIMGTLRRLNSPLADQLTSTVARRADEPPLHYNPDLVPDSFYTQMSGLVYPAHYALPRVYLELIAWGEPYSYQRLELATNSLEWIIRQRKPQSTDQLLLELAETALRLKLEPEVNGNKLLSHILCVPTLREENTRCYFQNQIDAMSEDTPLLADAYKRCLDSGDHQRFGVITPNQL